MLEKLNPYIRFARVFKLFRDAGETCVAYDNRLFLCMEGEFCLQTDREFRVSVGSAVFGPQYTLYRIHDAQTTLLSFNFDLTAAHSEYTASHSVKQASEWDGKKLYEDISLPFFDKAGCYDCTRISSALIRAADTFNGDIPFGRELASAELKAALIGMVSARHLAVHPAVAAFTQLVKERYMNDITAAGLAAEIGYHEGYLNRVIKRQLGVCISEYITNYRISKARDMLDAGCSVTETASACGFSELSYFSQCFKRRVGITPREYKRSSILL